MMPLSIMKICNNKFFFQNNKQLPTPLEQFKCLDHGWIMHKIVFTNTQMVIQKSRFIFISTNEVTTVDYQF
jgi:hypothetical protein